MEPLKNSNLVGGVNLDDEVTKENEAKKIALGLAPSFKWYDTLVPPTGMDAMRTNYGLAAYWGVMINEPITPGSDIVTPRKSHRCLVGVLIPGGNAHIFRAMSPILQRAALLLGCPDEDGALEQTLSESYYVERQRLTNGATETKTPIQWSLTWMDPEEVQARIDRAAGVKLEG